jgi:hypothetical protein
MWVSLPELASILGKDYARTFCLWRGGVELYVPKTPQPGHELAAIITWPGLRALAAQFGGEYITVPNGCAEPQKGRIMKLLEQGRPKAQIASECGVTERYVYHVAAQLGQLQPQLTLFG